MQYQSYGTPRPNSGFSKKFLKKINGVFKAMRYITPTPRALGIYKFSCCAFKTRARF